METKSRVWARCCLRLLKGSFSVAGRASQRNKPEHIRPAERGNMEHFLPQSDIRTEDHRITETAGCQLSLSESIVSFADVMLMYPDTFNKYPGDFTRRATLTTRTLLAAGLACSVMLHTVYSDGLVATTFLIPH